MDARAESGWREVGLIATIARQVLTDAMRARLFWLLLPLGLGLVATAPLVSALSLGAGHRGVLDISLTACWLLLVGVAVAQGTRSLGHDLHRGSAALFFARPTSRASLAGGRLAGTLAVLALFTLGTTTVWAGINLGAGVPLPSTALWLPLMWWCEASVVASCAFFLVTLVRPLPAGFLAMGLWVAGHLLDPYGQLAADTGNASLASVHQALSGLMPNYGVLDIHDAVVAGASLDPLSQLWAAAYALFWVGVWFGASVLVLERSDVG